MSIRRFMLCFGLVGAGLAGRDAGAQTPVHLWSQRFGGTSTEKAHSIAVDGAGNVLVTGFFEGTVNLGGSDLVSTGVQDIFVAKYDAAGVHQWSRRFGSAGSDAGNGLAVDGSGNVLLTGSFENSVDFGGGALVSAGGPDIFVAKFDASGVHQWSRRFGSTANDFSEAVAVDPAGDVALTGVFSGAVSFGGAALVSASGSVDIFVAKFNSAAVHQWSKRFGDTGNSDWGHSVAMDVSGNVVVTGYFSGDFGDDELYSTGGPDIFVAKFDSGGLYQWGRSFGSTGDDFGASVAVDGLGNVLLTGGFTGTVNFGGRNLVTTHPLDWDIFVAKFSPAGVHRWSQDFGSNSYDLGESVAVDGSGNVLLTGCFGDPVNFGGGDLVNTAGLDTYLAKFDQAGFHLWSQSFGQTTRQQAGIGAASVAADGSSNVLLTGHFNSTVDFGGGAFVSAGISDIFVAKFRPIVDPLIASVADVEHDQGRSVALRFVRSAADDSGSPAPVEQYEAFLRDDALPSATLAAPPTSRAISDLSLLTPGWLFVGSVPAHREDEYIMITPTLADSTIANGQHHSVFFVRAATSDPGVYYDSPPDSGYSLDNLAPGVPTGLAHGASSLTWDESGAADFDHFTVYGSTENSFVSATLIDHTVSPALSVSGSPYAHYFVTATDLSGNEGGPAVLHNPATSVDGLPRHHVLSVSAHPNPFNPATTIRYTLPASGRVKIAMHDARGARVATLLEADQPAGAYAVPWNGRDDAGALRTSGVYFARLKFGTEQRSYKTVLLK